MLVRRSDTRNVLEALTYAIKSHSHDGVNLMFTQSDRHVSTSRTKVALDEFDKVTFSGQTDMTQRLESIFEEVKRKITFQPRGWLSKAHHPPRQSLSQKLSLYILSDGNWQSGSDVPSTIQTMIAYLTEHNLPQKQIAIQFIRMGPDTPQTATFLDPLDGSHDLGLYGFFFYYHYS